MRTLSTIIYTVMAITASTLGQSSYEHRTEQVRVSTLDVKVAHFDVDDAILRDGLSELSSKNLKGLHLGFEEILRDKIQDEVRAQSPRFSLHLQEKTVREVLDELCRLDIRYAWSQNGATINVYPRATADDTSYLLNLLIDKIVVSDISNPDQALTPLSKKFPDQYVGYFPPGLGNDTYAEPWTATFEGLTVRQFIDRLAEHMGPETSWVWQGGKDERMFTFVKGGFHTR
jgi:hypothetical protein